MDKIELTQKQQAVLWLARGIIPMPIKKGSKYPHVRFSWKRYRTELPTTETVMQWFSRYQNSNIALLCGRVSNNLVVLDFDNLTGYFDWQYKTGIDTYTIRTGRGFHAYFTMDNLPNRSMKFHKLDIKSTGYVLAPGSLHPSGIIYTVINDKPILHVEGLESVVYGNGLECVCLGEAKPTNTPILGPSASTDLDTLLDYDDPFDYVPTLPKDISVQIKRVAKVLDVLGISENDLYERGGRKFALCPVHEDHDPSLDVDTETNRVFCYSPNCALHTPHGNSTIDLYMAMHNITSDRHALTVMARQLGLLGGV